MYTFNYKYLYYIPVKNLKSMVLFFFYLNKILNVFYGYLYIVQFENLETKLTVFHINVVRHLKY